MEVHDIYQTFYPFYDYRKREIYPSIALVYRVREDVEHAPGQFEAQSHTVVRAWNPRKGEIHTWCGDKFLEGTLTEADLAKRLEVFRPNAEAWTGINLQWKDAVDRMPDHACDFWKLHAKKEACEHVKYVTNQDHWGATNQVLRALIEQGNKGSGDVRFLDLIDPELILDLREQWGLEGDSGAVTEDDLAETLADLKANWHKSPQGIADKLAFRSPVLLEGEKGAGKTTLARELAEAHDATLIEIQGHESLEAVDLLGHFVPTQKSMVWKDGKLSQAFRLAGAGRKVVLLLDELLRIPQRQLSVLLGALSPYKGRYALATGRMESVVDGIGVEETLHCPVANIAVLATTNVGMQYAVDAIDPALADRFVPVRMNATEAKVRVALLEACLTKGFAEAVAKKLTTFWTKTTELLDNRQITEAPSLRVLVRCVQDADTEAEVPLLLRAHHLLFVSRDANGTPNASEIEALEKVTKRIFKE